MDLFFDFPESFERFLKDVDDDAHRDDDDDCRNYNGDEDDSHDDCRKPWLLECA